MLPEVTNKVKPSNNVDEFIVPAIDAVNTFTPEWLKAFVAVMGFQVSEVNGLKTLIVAADGLALPKPKVVVIEVAFVADAFDAVGVEPLAYKRCATV